MAVGAVSPASVDTLATVHDNSGDILIFLLFLGPWFYDSLGKCNSLSEVVFRSSVGHKSICIACLLGWFVRFR